LIPLTTDQPIQAELLKASQTGIALYPHEITEKNLYAAFQQLLDKTHCIHQRIHTTKKLFQESNGEIIAANLIEQSAKRRVSL
jgi:UDP:flavonoid glycosyltransferase YjiC (YdhE family)